MRFPWNWFEYLFGFSLSIEQFLENEDLNQLYILYRSSSSDLIAVNTIQIDLKSYERILLFIKTNLNSKLTKENLGEILFFSNSSNTKFLL